MNKDELPKKKKVEKGEVVSQQLISDKEKNKIINKEKRGIIFNIVFSKLFSIIFSGLVVVWIAICLIDYFQVQDSKNPIFCLNKEKIQVGEGSFEVCLGAGYKVLNFEKDKSCNIKLIFGPIWIKDKCPVENKNFK